MGGLIKHVFWIAPLGVLLLLATWYVNRETTVDIRTQDAAFDRDWNESMSVMTRHERAKYLDRAVAAQARYSSAQQEQAAKHQQMRDQEQDIDKAVQNLDSQLEGGRKL